MNPEDIEDLRAFPKGYSHQDGMTLRDYFAANAMQGIVSASMPDFAFTTYARWSYEIADEMIKARAL